MSSNVTVGSIREEISFLKFEKFSPKLLNCLAYLHEIISLFSYKQISPYA